MEKDNVEFKTINHKSVFIIWWALGRAIYILKNVFFAHITSKHGKHGTNLQGFR